MSNSEMRKRFIAEEMTLSIPGRISLLIKHGTITCHAFISSSGVDAWYRFADPKLQHKSFDGKGILEEFEKLSRKLPSPNVGTFDLDEEDTLSVHSPISSDNGSFAGLGGLSLLSARVPSTIQEARALVDGRGLNHYRKQGVLNNLASDSLTERDFKRPVDSLIARAFTVAYKRGQAKMWGTIGNQVSNHGATNFREWWDLASARERTQVMSSARTLDIGKIPATRLQAILGMACPF